MRIRILLAAVLMVCRHGRLSPFVHRSRLAVPRRGTGRLDARRSGRSGGHRLQLGHRAGPRRPRTAAAARQLRPQVHGHRRHRQPGDRPLPIADRTVAPQRPRAELRIRPARARQAAAEIRRPRRHAGAPAHGERRDPRRRGEGAPSQLQQRAGLADRRRDHHRHGRRSHQVSDRCRPISTRIRR